MAFENLKGKRFTAVTSSVSVKTAQVYRKTPAVVRLGKKGKAQGGFFNYDRILSASDVNSGDSSYADDAIIVVVDTASNETGLYLTGSVFKDNTNEFLQKTAGFNSSSYTQISASFFSQIGTAVDNMSASEAYVGVLTSPFEVGSVGSGSAIIAPVTASIAIKEAPGIATLFSGQPRKRKITYINSSSNFTNSHFFFNFNTATSTTAKFGDDEQERASGILTGSGRSHLTRSFKAHTNQGAENLFYYVQPKPIPEFSIEMTSSVPSNPTASFFAYTSSFSSSADFGVTSGSFIGRIIESSSTRPRFYNGSNHGGYGDGTDGKWHFVVQKAIIEGEGENHFGEANYETNGGDSGSNQAFTPQLLVVWYPSEYTYTNVRSASYYYTPYPDNMNEPGSNVGLRTKNLVTGSIANSEDSGSGELRLLYWLEHTYTSSFTASFGHFTRHQLRTQGAARNFQLPYMNTSRQYFGRSGRDANSSHLFKDLYLSQPADEGYYVHSSSFGSVTKNQMTASLGGPDHTSSFFVMGVFRHQFTALGGDTRNYTASQFKDPAVNGSTFMSAHPIASCMFLKRFDDQVFVYHASASGFILSESVG